MTTTMAEVTILTLTRIMAEVEQTSDTLQTISPLPLPAVHSTAPRSIRVEKPVKPEKHAKSGKKKQQDRREERREEQRAPQRPVHLEEPRLPKRLRNSQSVQEQPVSSPHSEVTVREPLNVRLQKLLSADQSSAWTILDILQVAGSRHYAGLTSWLCPPGSAQQPVRDTQVPERRHTED